MGGGEELSRELVATSERLVGENEGLKKALRPEHPEVKMRQGRQRTCGRSGAAHAGRNRSWSWSEKITRGPSGKGQQQTCRGPGGESCAGQAATARAEGMRVWRSQIASSRWPVEMSRGMWRNNCFRSRRASERAMAKSRAAGGDAAMEAGHGGMAQRLGARGRRGESRESARRFTSAWGESRWQEEGQALSGRRGLGWLVSVPDEGLGLTASARRGTRDLRSVLELAERGGGCEARMLRGGEP